MKLSALHNRVVLSFLVAAVLVASAALVYKITADQTRTASTLSGHCDPGMVIAYPSFNGVAVFVRSPGKDVVSVKLVGGKKERTVYRAQQTTKSMIGADFYVHGVNPIRSIQVKTSKLGRCNVVVSTVLHAQSK